jgi:hypothetical protein
MVQVDVYPAVFLGIRRVLQVEKHVDHETVDPIILVLGRI